MRKTVSKNVILMAGTVIFSVGMTVLFGILFDKYGHWQFESTFVTFLTISYHFIMRLIVGESVTLIYRKREFNLNSAGFRLHKFESALYEKLKVKKWKKYAITAKPYQFDVRKNSPEALLHNMAQAELAHRVIMVLSFVPLILIIPYGAAGVFITTSVLACLADMQFVIIERYNRPRVLRLIEKNIYSR